MAWKKQSGLVAGVAAWLVTQGGPPLCAQGTGATLRIERGNDGVTVSWSGRGTLQSASAVAGPWRDVLEAPNPSPIAPAKGQEFYRTISRWGMRASLLEANSEMALAELDGKIYVMGGYPASRVTRATVQVYDVSQDRWSLTTPLPVPLNHQMAAAVRGGWPDRGGLHQRHDQCARDV